MSGDTGAKAAGEPVQSPMAQLKEALVKAQEDSDRWQRQAEQQGSLFDLFKDTPATGDP